MQAAMIPIQKVLHFGLEANTTLRVGNSPSHNKDKIFFPATLQAMHYSADTEYA